MDYRTALGQVIRKERTAQGLTLRALSAEAHISLGHISDVERGTKDMSSDFIEYLANALGMPSYELVIRAGVAMAGEIPDTAESLFDFFAKTPVNSN
jgi:transcriptional regulator with XRE-family HTH domain